MTFVREGGRYRNGIGELLELESTFLFPMLRSSDVANNIGTPSRWMLVTQRHPRDDTSLIERTAPQTWAYLRRHANALSARASSIYKNRPEFAIFGTGSYSFAEYKVAISGLYKKIHFLPVVAFERKPVVLDDTCYFIDCGTEDECNLLARILSSPQVESFYSSLIFWDSKRPITADVLGRLSIEAAARELGLYEELQPSVDRRTNPIGQGALF